MFVQRFTNTKDSLGITNELAEQNANFKTCNRDGSQDNTENEYFSLLPITSIGCSRNMEQLTMVRCSGEPVNLAALRHGVEGNLLSILPQPTFLEHRQPALRDASTAIFISAPPKWQQIDVS
jgi:hypothetical protein